MEISAKEQLIILAPQDGRRGLGEVPGFTLYGLAEPNQLASNLLSGHLDLGDVVRSWRLFGSKWEVLLWDVRVSHWEAGETWRGSIKSLLIKIISGGARVAWMGAEFVSFSDPPRLFHPEDMDGPPAWMTSDGAFGVPLDPMEPWVGASDAELLRIREFARGLADVE